MNIPVVEPEIKYDELRKDIEERHKSMQNKGLFVKGILMNTETAVKLLEIEGNIQWDLGIMPKVLDSLLFGAIKIYPSNRLEKLEYYWVVE